MAEKKIPKPFSAEELGILANLSKDQPGGMERFWDDEGKETPLTETYAAAFKALPPNLKRYEINRKANQRKTGAAEATRATPKAKQRKRGETKSVKTSRRNTSVARTSRQDTTAEQNRQVVAERAKRSYYSEDDVIQEEDAREAARHEAAARMGIDTRAFFKTVGGRTTGVRYEPENPKAYRGYVSASTGQTPTEADFIASIWYMGGIPGIDENVRETLGPGTARPSGSGGVSGENAAGEQIPSDTEGIDTGKTMPSDKDIEAAKDAYNPSSGGGSEKARGTLQTAAEIEYAAANAVTPQFGDVSADEQAELDAKGSGMVAGTGGTMGPQFDVSTREGRNAAREASAARFIGGQAGQVSELRKAEQSPDTDIDPAAFKDIASGIEDERKTLALQDAQAWIDSNRDALAPAFSAVREATRGQKARFTAESNKIGLMKTEFDAAKAQGTIASNTSFESWRREKAATNKDEYGVSSDEPVDYNSFIEQEKKRAAKEGTPLSLTAAEVADPNSEIHGILEKAGFKYEQTRPVAYEGDKPINYNYVRAKSTRQGVKVEDGKDEEGKSTKNITGLGLIKEVVDEITGQGGEVVKVGAAGGGSYVKRNVTPNRLDYLHDLHEIAKERATRPNVVTRNSKANLGDRERMKLSQMAEGTGSGSLLNLSTEEREKLAASTKTSEFISDQGDPTRAPGFEKLPIREQAKITQKARREGILTPQTASRIRNPQYDITRRLVESQVKAAGHTEEELASMPESSLVATKVAAEMAKRKIPENIVQTEKVKDKDGRLVDKTNSRGTPIKVMRDATAAKPWEVRQLGGRALNRTYTDPVAIGPVGRQFQGYEALAARGIQAQISKANAEGTDITQLKDQLGLAQESPNTSMARDVRQGLVDADVDAVKRAVEVLNIRKPHVEQGIIDARDIESKRQKAQMETRKALEEGTHVNAKGEQIAMLTELPANADDAQKRAHQALRAVHTKAIKAAGDKAAREHLDIIASQGSVKRDLRGNMETEEVELPDGTVIDRPVSAGSATDTAEAEKANAVRLHVAQSIAGLSKAGGKERVIRRRRLVSTTNPDEAYTRGDSSVDPGVKWIDAIAYGSKAKEIDKKTGKPKYQEIELAPVKDTSTSTSRRAKSPLTLSEQVHSALESYTDTSETGEVSRPFGTLPNGMTIEALHDLGVSDRSGAINIPESTEERQRLSIAVRKRGWNITAGTELPSFGKIEMGRKIGAESAARKAAEGTSQVSETIETTSTSDRILPKSAGRGMIEPAGTVSRETVTRTEPSSPTATPWAQTKPTRSAPTPPQSSRLSSQFNVPNNANAYTRMALEGLKKAEFIKTPIEGENLGNYTSSEDQLKDSSGGVIGINSTTRNPLMGKPIAPPSYKTSNIETERIPVLYKQLPSLTPQETAVKERNYTVPTTGVEMTRRELSQRQTQGLGTGAHFGERGQDAKPTGRLFNAGQYSKIAPKRMRPQEASATAPAAIEAPTAVEDNTSDYAWSGTPASAPNTHLSMKQMGNTTNRVYDPTKGPSRMGREIIPQGM
jgi:hypothetical protein